MTLDELYDIIIATPHGMSCSEQVNARKALVAWFLEDRHHQYLSTDESVMLFSHWETKNRYAAQVCCVSLGTMIDLACLVQLSKGRLIPCPPI